MSESGSGGSDEHYNDEERPSKVTKTNKTATPTASPPGKPPTGTDPGETGVTPSSSTETASAEVETSPENSLLGIDVGMAGMTGKADGIDHGADEERGGDHQWITRLVMKLTRLCS